MRVDILHQHIRRDVAMMQAAVANVLPDAFPDHYTTKRMNVRSFVRRLNAITEPFRIFNELERDVTTRPGTMQTTGLWLGKDELPENGSSADVRVIWHIHPSTRLLTVTPTDWQRYRFYFWQMVMHELVHRAQDVYRQPDIDIKNFRPVATSRELKEQQKYYGNYDEIEAHSHDAAAEFLIWWSDLSYRDAVNAALDYTGRTVIPTYNFYASSFDGTAHPAMRTFRRKCRAWYQELKKHPDFFATLNLPKLIS